MERQGIPHGIARRRRARNEERGLRNGSAGRGRWPWAIGFVSPLSVSFRFLSLGFGSARGEGGNGTMGQWGNGAGRLYTRVGCCCLLYIITRVLESWQGGRREEGGKGPSFFVHSVNGTSTPRDRGTGDGRLGCARGSRTRGYLRCEVDMGMGRDMDMGYGIWDMDMDMRMIQGMHGSVVFTVGNRRLRTEN